MRWPYAVARRTMHDAADKTARSMQCRPCTAHRAAYSIQTNTADNVAHPPHVSAARTDPVTASTHEVWRSHTTHDSHAEAVHGTTGTVKPRRAEDIGLAMRFR